MMKTDDGVIAAIKLAAQTQAGYDIMTAMRGPDFDSESLKNATTSVIRYKLGIPEDNIFCCFSQPDNEESLSIRKEYYPSQIGESFVVPFDNPNGHFLNHAYRAFKALGLKWNEVNL